MGLRWRRVWDKGERQPVPILLQIHGQCPEKHSQGLVFNQCIRVVRGQARLWKWDTTEIKVQKYNAPWQPGASKPELGTARLFLWFDPRAHSLSPSLVSPCWCAVLAPGTKPLFPHRAGWESQGHGWAFWGGETQGQGHGEGTKGNVPHGRGEETMARQSVSKGGGGVFWQVL